MALAQIDLALALLASDRPGEAAVAALGAMLSQTVRGEDLRGAYAVMQHG